MNCCIILRRQIKEVNCLKDFNFDIMKALKPPAIDPKLLIPPKIPRVENLASDYVKRLVEYMNDYEAGLDEQHEVGLKLVNFSQTLTLHVLNIGYYNPGLVCFYCNTLDGEPAQLVQHISQISFLLTSVQRMDMTQPKRRIGFCTSSEDSESDTSD